MAGLVRTSPMTDYVPLVILVLLIAGIACLIAGQLFAAVLLIAIANTTNLIRVLTWDRR